jgi:hypothetical protein
MLDSLHLSFYLEYRNNLIYESIFRGELYQRLLKNLVGLYQSDYHLLVTWQDLECHSAVNYRPVSLTAICRKVLEHIITSNIRKHLSQNKYYMIANTVLEAKDPARHNWSSESD